MTMGDGAGRTGAHGRRVARRGDLFGRQDGAEGFKNHLEKCCTKGRSAQRVSSLCSKGDAQPTFTSSAVVPVMRLATSTVVLPLFPLMLIPGDATDGESERIPPELLLLLPTTAGETTAAAETARRGCRGVGLELATRTAPAPPPPSLAARAAPAPVAFLPFPRRSSPGSSRSVTPRFESLPSLPEFWKRAKAELVSR